MKYNLNKAVKNVKSKIIGKGTSDKYLQKINHGS